ncbi:triphosphoribosyl-dephospho-CoA synthase CitG [Clostridium sp. SHJSY1]|uniref:triphosphoribosyl-dephospho-CoA synthase CitG n=1 Tax=Clostridium sp. SHJSY1 TaxID=2942483 RepID=UPI002876B5A0|nr:triphosphoribosyl-dephospho-CoA synthase CitG [Clostridium sp. SHJSY1]MDS0526486.1 triphosphoribosyl-dephospho-CoA synthase CitG [Clostridium sp. SHJSY1]
MRNEDTFMINNFSMKISEFAVQAMIYEVACYPSPGLVSPVSKGAHNDMDFFTFIDSISVLNKYFMIFVQEGFSDRSYKEIFERVRIIGIEAEKDMFIKTKGVNTHKGMLFLIGIICAAIGKAFNEKKNFDEIKYIIQYMAKGIVDTELTSLKNKSELSHGEALYIKYNIQGIRGEVERGIPTVFDFSLDLYKQSKDLSINDRLIHTLIGIMQICDDSTIIHRHSIEVLEEVKERSKEIISFGGMKSEMGRRKINSLCSEFIKRNISPGGSADLLGVTVFLDLVEEYMRKM